MCICTGKGEDARAPGQGPSGAPCREKKLVNTATQCGKPPLHTTSGSSSGGKGRALHRDEVSESPSNLLLLLLLLLCTLGCVFADSDPVAKMSVRNTDSAMTSVRMGVLLYLQGRTVS